MEKTPPKVSIIVPCYNSEKYLDGFFRGILTDSHTRIELIMVNDGSTDRTEEKILGYRQQIEQRGGELVYIKQENKGLPGAISAGLKVFTGDYLIWPDPDDELINNSIGDRVAYMERHPDVMLLLTNFITVQEENPETEVDNSTSMFKKWNADTFFEDLLDGKSGVGPPYYIARSEAVLRQIPDRTIYSNRSGQNYQLVLPLAFHDKVAIWKESRSYYKYYLRSSSHSHTNKEDMEKALDHATKIGENITETLKRIPNMTPAEQAQYLKKADNWLTDLQLCICFTFGDRKRFMELFSQFRRNGIVINRKNRIKRLLWQIPGGGYMLKYLKRR